MTSVKFGYRGKYAPSHWGQLQSDWKIAKTGHNQSPINLCTKTCGVSHNLSEVKCDWRYDDNVKIVNNGISPTYYVTPNKHFLVGGPLDEKYELVQFHIHFSNTEDKGSEHTIDGRAYAAEIHFVHYKVSYGSFSEAVKHSDGLAVVGAFIGVDDNDNHHQQLTDDVNKLSDVKEVGSEMTCSIDLSAYRLECRDYYTYAGSLTTPGCAECVRWIVIDQALYITSHAYSALQTLQSQEGGLMAEPGNYRPVQPLSGRKVLSSFDPNRVVING